MANAVVMPKQGNTVESCIIVQWHRKVGEQIAVGELLCEVETDKATLEVESTAAGTILELFFEEGDDVPVLTPIVAVGELGEDITSLRPEMATNGTHTLETQKASAEIGQERTKPPSHKTQGIGAISPRARNLAIAQGVEYARIQGTGPGGRIIERDVRAAMASRPTDRQTAHARVTPVAQRMLQHGEFVLPDEFSQAGGRITSRDLLPAAPSPGPEVPIAPPAGEIEQIPVQGVRKVIAERMLHSLQTTAQLTLNASADARALLSLRKRLKESDESLGLRGVTIGDLILFAVSRTLPEFPDINALFQEDAISRFRQVHLAFAVDTPRGLLVPVIKNAESQSLKQLSAAVKRLTTACQEGRVAPDDLTGGTFTVSNLGAFGIESFTPVLNPPQVAILGVGNINLKPIDLNGEVNFVPHIGLSLTINHQVIDGVPGARFLGVLSAYLTQLDLLLAV